MESQEPPHALHHMSQPSQSTQIPPFTRARVLALLPYCMTVDKQLPLLGLGPLTCDVAIVTQCSLKEMGPAVGG